MDDKFQCAKCGRPVAEMTVRRSAKVTGYRCTNPECQHGKYIESPGFIDNEPPSWAIKVQQG